MTFIRKMVSWFKIFISRQPAKEMVKWRYQLSEKEARQKLNYWRKHGEGHHGVRNIAGRDDEYIYQLILLHGFIEDAQLKQNAEIVTQSPSWSDDTEYQPKHFSKTYSSSKSTYKGSTEDSADVKDGSAILNIGNTGSLTSSSAKSSSYDSSSSSCNSGC